MAATTLMYRLGCGTETNNEFDYSKVQFELNENKNLQEVCIVKRILALLCTISLLIGLCTPAYAETDSPTVILERVSAQAGECVDVPIRLENNTGICGAILAIEYDSEIVITGITQGEALSTLTMTKPGKLSANPFRLVWDGLEEDASNGVIAILTVTAPSEPGEYAIKVTAEEVLDGNLNAVDLKITNGEIVVPDPEEPHVHNYGTGVVTKEPTCTEDGIKTYTCSGCGDSYTEEIPKKGHSYSVSITEPTCTQKGYKTYTCSACGNTYTENTVDALGHNYVYTNNGSKHTVTCSRCDYRANEAHVFNNGKCVCGARSTGENVTLSNPVVVADSTMNAGQKATWDCVWFGSFPQAEVVNSEEMIAAAIPKNYMEYLEDDGFIVDSSLYDRLQNANGWIDNEIVIDGERYRRMKKSDATYAVSINYDRDYWWTDDTSYHYFKYQPIKWRVLNIVDGKALLIADKVLEYEEYTHCTGATFWIGTVWENSTLRSWFNGYDGSANRDNRDYTKYNFVGCAFDEAELNAIICDTVQNNQIGDITDGSGISTKDRVFALSYSQAMNPSYGFTADTGDDEGRSCKATTYAFADGMGFTIAGDWGLRTVNTNMYYWEVLSGGKYYSNALTGGSSGTRPALILDISNNVWSYAGTVCSDGTVDEQNGPSDTDSTLCIIRQPENVSGAPNDELSISLEARGDNLIYQWYYSSDGGKVFVKSGTPGYNTNTLQPVLRAYRDGFQYYCVVSDSNGASIKSNVVTMTVESSDVSITQQPENITDGVINQLHTFRVSAEGKNLAYRWYWSADNGETWTESYNDGFDTDSLTVRLYSYRSGYLYKCIVTSGLKVSAESESALLKVQEKTAEIVTQPVSVTLAAGNTASFVVEATGTNLSYLWYSSSDGVTWTQTWLSGYNTNTLSFPVTTARAAKYYRCVVSDGSGYSVTSTKAALVTAAPQITVEPKDQTVAAGNTATFTVEASGTGLTYLWYSSSDGVTWSQTWLDGYNTPNLSFNVSAGRAGKYYRCAITDMAENTVVSQPAYLTLR